MDEIKKSLDALTGKSTVMQDKTLVNLLKEVKDLVKEEVKSLKKLIKEKDDKIAALERRADELEQYTRKDNVVISGLKTRHRSYARVASGESGGEDAPLNELQTLEEQVIHFFHSKQIAIEKESISACHLLPKRASNRAGQTEPNIIMRFANRKHKTDLLRQGRKLKGTNVFMNEHLTKKNADMARCARLLRKQNKINSTWTRDCKIWIRTNGSSTEEEKSIVIREMEDLERFQ